MNKFKECNQCPYEFNDKNLEPCKDCVPKKKTNADRIRSMSDEELAMNMMCPNENGLGEIECNKDDGWIPCSKQLPPHSDDLLLIQCSGKPKNNIVFNNAFCLASYTKEGWLLELYPEWKGAEVIAWQPLPEPYQPKGE